MTARRRDFDLAVLAACERQSAEFTVEVLVSRVPAPGADQGPTAKRNAISEALSRLTVAHGQLVRVRRGVYKLRAEREPLPQLPPQRSRAEKRTEAERRAARLLVTQRRAARRVAIAISAWTSRAFKQGEPINGHQS